MAISSVNTDYSGRTKDFLIMQSLSPYKTGAQQVMLGFGKPSQYCAGIQKLVQRYMISFLTGLGTQPGSEDFGTNFIQSLNSTYRNISNIEVGHIFNFANGKVTQEFKQYQAETQDIPLDEQLRSATLEGFTSVDGRIDFSIRITSMAGETITFVAPLPKII